MRKINVMFHDASLPSMPLDSILVKTANRGGAYCPLLPSRSRPMPFMRMTIWPRHVGVENNADCNFKGLEEMLGSAKALKRNNRKSSGILIGPQWPLVLSRFRKIPSSWSFGPLAMKRKSASGLNSAARMASRCLDSSPEANLSLNGGQPQEQQQNGGVHEKEEAMARRTTAGAGQFNELTISGDHAENAKIPSLVR